MSRFRVRVLKVDCKVCEYELVNDDSLKLFDIVRIKYSGYLANKTYHELMSKLERLELYAEYGHTITEQLK